MANSPLGPGFADSFVTAQLPAVHHAKQRGGRQESGDGHFMAMPPLDGADLLLRAATALGSAALLAERLGVTTDQLGAWLRREETTPDIVLIEAAKIIGSRTGLVRGT